MRRRFHSALRAGLVLLLAGCGLTVLFLSGCGLTDAARLLEDAVKPASELAGLVAEREATVDGIRVRRYGSGPSILLCHGAVADGIDDPRLVAFARALALRGFEVATPHLESLCRFRVDAGDPARIARAAGDGPVALVGISIGGSYCLIAAARPELRNRVTTILSFGGYADLEALLGHWLTDPGEGPPELLDPLREGRQRVLAGNRDRLDPASTEAAMRSDRPLTREDAAKLLRPILPDLRALSPITTAARQPNVFLLHAENDPVVPASDARVLHAHYAGSRLLVTDLFSHVEAEKKPGFFEAYPLLRFLAEFLRSAR